ncbi:low-specificity L-threonine aldolase [bacterium]|nr:low-specificity L-threonine aldolase [bacterium]MBU1064440.1 low-specificity L-threonine aldolase [bacterium]MBU1632907.1 low-specificity L-threonine aldolase [bacterium]MBU1873270.1 low-specificity L-threonine aldolase [bacterium]
MPRITIDLRSDTVTKPSQAMRNFIAHADVGDDVYGEDPTVNLLEERVADLLGKEAALYVPSGTMSNQIAIKTHTQPGQEVICEENCHIFNYEAGAPAFLSHVQMRPLHGEYGVLNIKDVENAIRADNLHLPPTGLICVENTHNRAGGTVYPLDNISELANLTAQKGIPLHLDGARLMNAVVATGIPAKDWASYADSVSLCFSKGLGAPVGSVLSGPRDFIQRARKYRKIFGGGMRQAGILAAACIFALDNNVNRLKEDHENARLLASELKNLAGIFIDMKQVQTNMVMIYIRHPKYNSETLSRALLSKGLAANAVDSERIRAVTHLNISKDQILQAVEIFTKLMKES